MSERLVDRARRGDVDAFVALVEGRREAMTRITVAILGNRADADDALQEALTTTWRELPRLRDPSHFDAWADRILVNACRLVLRRRRRRIIREIPTAGSEDGPSSGSWADPPDRELADRDSFRRAFETLDGSSRELLVLRHLEEWPIAQIASVLGIPPGTVKSRLFTARRALEAALDAEDRG